MKGLTATESLIDGDEDAQGWTLVVGVAAGTVAYLSDDGDESRLTVIDAASGDSRVVTTTSDRLIGGRLSPDGATAFLVAADRARESLTALLATDLASGATSQLAGIGPAGRVRAGALQLSLDGSALVLEACMDDFCELRLVATDTGASSTLSVRPANFQLIGLAAHHVVGRPLCEEGPCRRWLIERSTGDVASDPVAAGRYLSHAVITGPRGHELVIGQLSGAANWGDAVRRETDPPLLEVVDLTTGRTLELATPDLYAMQIAHPPLDPSVGVELPPGWVLVSGITSRDDETISYFALNVANGEAWALPALGERDRP